MNPEVLARSGLCFLLKGEVVTAPARSEGCCVRPSKLPNPSFSESFRFSFVAAAVGCQRSTEGKGHVWVSSWELLGTTGEPRPGAGVGMSFK